MNNLTAIRRENNITLGEMSEMTGYSVRELRAYEAGKRNLQMDLEITEKLAEAGISVGREEINDNYEKDFTDWFFRFINHEQTEADEEFLAYNIKTYGKRGGFRCVVRN